jgi:hypothetical protein
LALVCSLARSLAVGAALQISIHTSAFVSVVRRFMDRGACRNDTTPPGTPHTPLLWVSLSLYTLMVPFLRGVFEASVAIVKRGAADTLALTEAEDWRKRLRRPMTDAALVLGSCLGALMLPEGYQASTSEPNLPGRTCVRGPCPAPRPTPLSAARPPARRHASLLCVCVVPGSPHHTTPPPYTTPPAAPAITSGTHKHRYLDAVAACLCCAVVLARPPCGTFYILLTPAAVPRLCMPVAM